MKVLRVLFIFTGLLQMASSQNGEVKEYCPLDVFEANCHGDSVIVMTEAHYGLMKIGRCVKTDFGYIGCYQDVLGILNARCSGRQSCRISIPDPELDRSEPCPRDLIRYLEAGYKCMLEGEYLETSTSAAAVESTVGKANTPEVKEYCEDEVFVANCHGDSVIAITEARYGRMKIGRCVKTDYGYIGCYQDVLGPLNARCSGRQSCQFRLPHPELDQSTPCPREFKKYLEVAYKCVLENEDQHETHSTRNFSLGRSSVNVGTTPLSLFSIKGKNLKTMEQVSRGELFGPSIIFAVSLTVTLVIFN